MNAGNTSLRRETNAQAPALLQLAAIAAIAAFAGCDTSLESLLSSMFGTNKPTVAAPANLTVECDGAGNAASLNAWLAGATFTPGCGGAMLTNDFTALNNECGAAGMATVTWTVTDACGNAARDSATFRILDTTAPTLGVPDSIIVSCADPTSPAALLAWRDSATAADVCASVTIKTLRSTAPDGCTALMTWTATDACGNHAGATAGYTTTDDTTDPSVTLSGADRIHHECGDPFDDPGAVAADDCDALIVADVQGSVDIHTPGAYLLTYSATDACGNTASSVSRTVTVTDTRPPVVHVNDPLVLWPPNHDMKALRLSDLFSAVDACEGEMDVNAEGHIVAIYSDEPDNTNGDGNTSGDIVISGSAGFSLRAERTGGGNGRVYGIQFAIGDASHNIATGTAFVHVPHDQSGGAATDDGPAAGQTVTP